METLALSPLRKTLLRLRGLKIGRTTLPRCRFTWPHKVSIGDGCQIEEGVVFKHDGVWSEGTSIQIADRVWLCRGCEFNITHGISIGPDTLIASGCKFIDHDHNFTDREATISSQKNQAAAITIESDVWLGVNVVVLQGVTIGRGAVVGAGAVVTKSIPPFEIWAGIPAKKIGVRG